MHTLLPCTSPSRTSPSHGWAGRSIQSAVAVLLTVMLLAACVPGTGNAEDATEPERVATSAETATDKSAISEPSVSPAPQETATAVPQDGTDFESADSKSQGASAERASGLGRVERFAIVPEETTAGYSIQEVFISDQNTLATAVGLTNEVQGGLFLNYDDPAASEFDPFVVDISTLKSDRSRRDRAIRAMWLESSRFPLATFEVAEVRDFPEDPEERVPLSFQLAGDFTVRETTREVVWDVTASLEDDLLTGTATLETMLADFDIPVPSIANILRVTDGITLTLDFVMERVSQ